MKHSSDLEKIDAGFVLVVRRLQKNVRLANMPERNGTVETSSLHTALIRPTNELVRFSWQIAGFVLLEFPFSAFLQMQKEPCKYAVSPGLLDLEQM